MMNNASEIKSLNRSQLVELLKRRDVPQDICESPAGKNANLAEHVL